MRFRFPVVLGLLPVLTAACLGSTEPDEEEFTGVPVMFVGNSLTYYNDMPFMISAMAMSRGEEPLGIGSMLIPGYSLHDHWEDGRARVEMQRYPWLVVVLQQGPSSTPENRIELQEWAEVFATEARSNGSQPALFMVWPEKDRLQDFDAVSESYREAADAVEGILFPVGEAWRAAWRRDPDAELYGNDGFHPSVAGSYLAALVMFEQIYDQTPIGLPGSMNLPFGPVSLDPELALTLQEAAAEANAQFATERVIRPAAGS